MHMFLGREEESGHEGVTQENGKNKWNGAQRR